MLYLCTVFYYASVHVSEAFVYQDDIIDMRYELDLANNLFKFKIIRFDY